MSIECRVIPRLLAWPIVAGGFFAIFATYWDEAWHTDIGRDSAWLAPHVLLYGSVAVVGLCVAGWGLICVANTRSVLTVLRHDALLVAALGGLGALASAPLDAAWHAAYGRDAVLWSPPHMLVVFAATALTLGVLSAIPAQAVSLQVAMGALLLANAVAVVFEYEADVPQFTEVLYLPVLLISGVLVAGVVSRTVGGRSPVTKVVLVYVAVRLCVSAGLALLGRSTPDLPIAVLGLAAFDVPATSRTRRYAAAAGATASIAWVSSALELASPPQAALAVVAVPVVVVVIATLGLGQRRTQIMVSLILAAAAATTVVATPEPAAAHDPGQGRRIMRADLRLSTHAGGMVSLNVRPEGRCDGLGPRRVVARRAGQVVDGPLQASGNCEFAGVVQLPTQGRWFVYAELNFNGERVEVWLPADATRASTTTSSRELYRPPAVGPNADLVQLSVGALIYLLGLLLLGLGVRATTRPRTRAAL